MIAEHIASLPLIFVRGIINFFYFWYIQSSKNFWNKETMFLQQIERDLGIKINLKLIAQPIFGDYSYMGRVIGPLFRLGRVAIGAMIMTASIVTVILIYLIWIILPPLSVLMILINLIYLV